MFGCRATRASAAFLGKFRMALSSILLLMPVHNPPGDGGHELTPGQAGHELAPGPACVAGLVTVLGRSG